MRASTFKPDFEGEKGDYEEKQEKNSGENLFRSSKLTLGEDSDEKRKEKDMDSAEEEELIKNILKGGDYNAGEYPETGDGDVGDSIESSADDQGSDESRPSWGLDAFNKGDDASGEVSNQDYSGDESEGDDENEED